MRHHAFAATVGIAAAALFAPGSTSHAASADPTGYWVKPDAERESKIQVFKCGKDKTLLCAKIAWLKDPNNSKGKPLTDIRNENPSLRNRQIVGLTIFTGLAPTAPSTWTGKIYNPEDGQTYSATLTVVSRKQIQLKGCKAWLLCGERQWLRTTAPEELTPSAPAEETQQIEASVTPPLPKRKALAVAELTAAQSAEPAGPAVPSEVPDVAAVPEDEPVAAAEPAISAHATAATIAATPVAFVTEEAAAPAAPSDHYNWRRGYRFLSLSANVETPEPLSGENVSSMFAMANPLADAGQTPVPENGTEATAAIQSSEPVPAPQQKPKVQAKAIAAAAAAPKPAPKQATAAKPAGQAAPAQDADQATGAAHGAQAATAEAMADSSTLTRRQRRLLRRQQQQDPFLPWLR